MGVDWQLTFQGVKTILDPIASAGWPIVIGGGLIGFREPIIDLIKRVQQFKAGGVGVNLGLHAQQQFEQSVETLAALPAEKAAGENRVMQESILNAGLPPPNDVYDILDTQARTWLDQCIQGDNERKLAWAIRMRSVSEANRLHEYHYRIMFGSQLQALRALNLAGRTPISNYELYFKAAAESEPWRELHRNRTFDDWANFLINIGYVKVIPNSNPVEVDITSFGRQFLVWIPEARAPEWRPG